MNEAYGTQQSLRNIVWGKNLTRQAARSKAENTAQWAMLCQVQMYDTYNRVLFVFFVDIFIDLHLEKVY